MREEGSEMNEYYRGIYEKGLPKINIDNGEKINYDDIPTHICLNGIVEGEPVGAVYDNRGFLVWLTESVEENNLFPDYLRVPYRNIKLAENIDTFFNKCIEDDPDFNYYDKNNYLCLDSMGDLKISEFKEAINYDAEESNGLNDVLAFFGNNICTDKSFRLKNFVDGINLVLSNCGMETSIYGRRILINGEKRLYVHDMAWNVNLDLSKHFSLTIGDTYRNYLKSLDKYHPVNLTHKDYTSNKDSLIEFIAFMGFNVLRNCSDSYGIYRSHIFPVKYDSYTPKISSCINVFKIRSFLEILYNLDNFNKNIKIGAVQLTSKYNYIRDNSIQINLENYKTISLGSITFNKINGTYFKTYFNITMKDKEDIEYNIESVVFRRYSYMNNIPIEENIRIILVKCDDSDKYVAYVLNKGMNNSNHIMNCPFCKEDLTQDELNGKNMLFCDNNFCEDRMGQKKKAFFNGLNINISSEMKKMFLESNNKMSPLKIFYPFLMNDGTMDGLRRSLELRTEINNYIKSINWREAVPEIISKMKFRKMSFNMLNAAFSGLGFNYSFKENNIVFRNRLYEYGYDTTTTEGIIDEFNKFEKSTYAEELKFMDKWIRWYKDMDRTENTNLKSFKNLIVYIDERTSPQCSKYKKVMEYLYMNGANVFHMRNIVKDACLNYDYSSDNDVINMCDIVITNNESMKKKYKKERVLFMSPDEVAKRISENEFI